MWIGSREIWWLSGTWTRKQSASLLDVIRYGNSGPHPSDSMSPKSDLFKRSGRPCHTQKWHTFTSAMSRELYFVSLFPKSGTAGSLSRILTGWAIESLSVTPCFPVRYTLRPKKQLSIKLIFCVALPGPTDNFKVDSGFNMNIVPLQATPSCHSLNSQLPKKSPWKNWCF